MMIRKLLLPAVAVAMLGGCMTGGYSYRQDRGDYYYGQPGVDYRQHNGGYGYPYGYGDGYYNGYYSNSYYYRRGYPYYYNGYPYGRPPVVVVRPRPDGDSHPDRGDHDGDNKAPWRDYERLQRERVQRTPVVQRQPMSAPVRAAVPTVRRARSSNDEGGSRMERVIRRAKRGAVEQDD